MPLSKRALLSNMFGQGGMRYTHQRVEYIAQCRRYPTFPPISPHYGCGGIDAAPQAHVRSAKKVYPQTREVMGYPAIPGAPFDSTRRRR